uniref:Zgc:112982 n=1 Tax=Amphilophus citrinellus TaxID=61819 RepID=A0A3Q0RTH7_AMPCI
MLEHSGTYRETAMHTGTFAQEIITLVHLVKEQYFRGDGVTLNERFSAPQKGGYSEDEMEELTLDDGFDTDRQQPVRGPGDLRHDLERRRQEKLEGVKVTIPGNTMTQHHLGPVRCGVHWQDVSDGPEEARRKHGEHPESGYGESHLL